MKMTPPFIANPVPCQSPENNGGLRPEIELFHSEIELFNFEIELFNFESVLFMSKLNNSISGIRIIAGPAFESDFFTFEIALLTIRPDVP